MQNEVGQHIQHDLESPLFDRQATSRRCWPSRCSLIHSLTHSLTQSITHSITHSPLLASAGHKQKVLAEQMVTSA